MTVSITPSDHNSALHNGGLVEEHGNTPRGQLAQGIVTFLLSDSDFCDVIFFSFNVFHHPSLDSCDLCSCLIGAQT